MGCKANEHLCVNVTATEFEWYPEEPEEVFVDDPAEVLWLAELVHGVSVDGPLVLPSSWAGGSEKKRKEMQRHKKPHYCMITM